jgi:hypothetical protein
VGGGGGGGIAFCGPFQFSNGVARNFLHGQILLQKIFAEEMNHPLTFAMPKCPHILLLRKKRLIHHIIKLTLILTAYGPKELFLTTEIITGWLKRNIFLLNQKRRAKYLCNFFWVSGVFHKNVMS